MEANHKEGKRYVSLSLVRKKIKNVFFGGDLFSVMTLNSAFTTINPLSCIMVYELNMSATTHTDIHTHTFLLYLPQQHFYNKPN